MRFSIIVIHRNGLNRLRSTLDSIISATSLIDEIILVDNASTDNSIQEISKIYEGINIIKNTVNLGYGRAANQAINSGKGKYFLICNNDIFVPSNILNNFEELFINEPRAGIISGQQTNLKGEITRTSSRKHSYLSELDGIGRLDHAKDPQKISEVSTLRGACLAVRKKMIGKIGAFDTDFFFYYEDTEWCIRAKNHRWKVLLNPSIRFIHIGGASSDEFFKESRIEFYRSRIIFWGKVFPRLIVIILHLWNIPKLLLDLIFYSIAVSVTFGQNKRLRRKMQDRVSVFLWLCLGKPNSWGLPKK